MHKKERKLSPSELKRKENYDRLCEDMENRGYQKRDLTVSIVTANIAAGFVMLPFAVLALWLYYRVNSLDASLLSHANIWLLAAFLVLTVLHEAIHGLTWGLFAPNHLQSIAFGVVWQALTPYCTCSEALTRRQYLLGSAMPTLILGFGLAAAATLTGQPWLFLLSEIMIFAGGGDFLIILKLLSYKQKGQETLYYDHPYECGLVVFEKGGA